MNVVVNGLMTNYQKVGRGKVVVCLPGWGDTITTFSKLVAELKEKYTVLALDLPGFGGTQAPSKAWSLEEYANFTAAWLDKIKAGRVYAIIGHSYGGATAITGVGEGHLACERLILLASAGIRGNKSLNQKTLSLVAKIAKYPTYLLPRRYRNKLRRGVYEALGSDMLLLPHMEPTFKEIIRQDVRQKAKQVAVPTLLIYGSADNQTPVSDGRLLAEAIPNSNLKIIDGANHFLHHDSTGQVSRLIKAFLRKKDA